MIPYLIPLLIVILCIIQYDILNHKGYNKIIWGMLCIYAIFLTGLRYRVGGDTINYMEGFANIPTISNLQFLDFADTSYQPLFLLMCVIAKTISSDFVSLQILHAAILNICIFKFIKKHSEGKPFIYLFFYFVLFFHYFNFEIMKESLAIAFFLLNYDNFQNRRWSRYYLLVVVSLGFHLSAAILLLLPLMRWIKLNYFYWIILIFFFLLLKQIQPYLEVLETFEKLDNKMSIYLNEIEQDKLNINWLILQLAQTIFLPIITLLYAKFILKIRLKYEFFICTYIIVGIGVIMFQIVFMRFSNYFLPFYAFFLGYFLVALYKKGVSGFQRIIVFLLISVNIFVYGYNMFSHGGYKKWIPYYSIFTMQEDSERESLRL